MTNYILSFLKKIIVTLFEKCEVLLKEVKK